MRYTDLNEAPAIQVGNYVTVKPGTKSPQDMVGKTFLVTGNDDGYLHVVDHYGYDEYVDSKDVKKVAKPKLDPSKFNQNDWPKVMSFLKAETSYDLSKSLVNVSRDPQTSGVFLVVIVDTQHLTAHGLIVYMDSGDFEESGSLEKNLKASGETRLLDYLKFMQVEMYS